MLIINLNFNLKIMCMKKIFVSIAVAMLCVNVFSQNTEEDLNLQALSLMMSKIYNITTDVSTTEAEYNYCINGIPTSITNSLDIKAGYKIEGYNTLEEYNASSYTYNSGNYSIKFDNLIRTVDNTIAAVLIKVYSSDSEKTYHRCMPIGNATLNEKFLADFQKWSQPMQIAFSQALMEFSLNNLVLLNGVSNKIMKSPNSNAILKSFGLTEEEINILINTLGQ